jgi:NAD(P)-dependent dehydrogenase (short-subunit alcohol dehydrogenase family)
LFFCGDVSDEAVLREFAEQVKKRFCGVDYLINNACVSKKGILSGCSYADFNYVLRTGVTAPYMLCMLLLNSFTAGASIVNIASTRAFMSQADTESYSAAKGGIFALTHALSVSLSGKVRVNSLSPGWIDTSAYHAETAKKAVLSKTDHTQHPAGRVGVPLDIAKMAMFLCSSAAEFITGQNFTVDGGMTKRMIYHNDEGWVWTGQE